MPYGTPELLSDYSVEYAMTLRHSANTQFVASLTFSMQELPNGWDSTAEAACDAAFQEFVDLIDDSPNFEAFAYAPAQQPMRRDTIRRLVTPTP